MSIITKEYPCLYWWGPKVDVPQPVPYRLIGCFRASCADCVTFGESYTSLSLSWFLWEDTSKWANAPCRTRSSKKEFRLASPPTPWAVCLVGLVAVNNFLRQQKAQQTGPQELLPFLDTIEHIKGGKRKDISFIIINNKQESFPNHSSLVVQLRTFLTPHGFLV